jgi:hypothetical protein
VDSSVVLHSTTVMQPAPLKRACLSPINHHVDSIKRILPMFVKCCSRSNAAHGVVGCIRQSPMCCVHLYTVMMRCQLHDLSISKIFDGLTEHCISISCGMVAWRESVYYDVCQERCTRWDERFAVQKAKKSIQKNIESFL